MRLTTTVSERECVVISAGGTTLVVDTSGGVPDILYWGPPFEASDDAARIVDALTEVQWTSDGPQSRLHPGVVPAQSSGWMGTPGLEGHRDGRFFTTRFERVSSTRDSLADGTEVLKHVGRDSDALVSIEVEVHALSSGLVRVRAIITNDSTVENYVLNSLKMALPVPAQATEILDFAGKHLKERVPQRQPFSFGTHLREARRGKPGSDGAYVLVAGTEGFAHTRGQAWAVHVGWSGNQTLFAERSMTGRRYIGGGELLLPGEVTLPPGNSYSAPWLYAAHGVGLNEITAQFHAHARSIQRFSHPRPVILNTWEAVYFDHDISKLRALLDAGAEVGVERFVLDDGWFGARVNDRAGLGDWQVSAQTWPNGLAPLVAEVRARGMQFGLWFEPEMINEDSETARSHPEWILGAGERLPLPARNQQVINLANPDAYHYVLESISSLVAELQIDYIKWDHNRDLLEAGDRADNQARVHLQTRATYAMMDELRHRHPSLEIESCASGGGRVDLGMLEHTDRVWGSDCIDPLERQRIQRGTALLLPPEIVGSHVGAPTAHTTHRTHSLAFRAATALFGSFGIEWDLLAASALDRAELSEWVDLYKQTRALVHSGRYLVCDTDDETYWCYGVVAQDQSEAIFAFVSIDSSAAAMPQRIQLVGLDDAAQYRLEPINLCASALAGLASGPPRWVQENSVASGHLLRTVGVQAPLLYPEQSFLVRLVRADN
ncbi:alpha-galactosidase [Salinibacterium sp. CAN_S4]|uniref:alpha-galactosidase n=1 Tax=Salinibacterium sp. CAN_S4 TaxID=2787727 RepID=UPI0018F03E2A